jgi:glucose/arabinose dehydrogenase
MDAGFMARFLKILGGFIALLLVAVAAFQLFGPAHDTRMILHAALGIGGPQALETKIGRIRVPEGFAYTTFAHVTNARGLAVTSANDVIVSQPRLGQVTLLQHDTNGDGIAEGERILLKDLDLPQGVLVWNGYLYVAETGAVGRISFDAATGVTHGSFQRIIEGLPKGENHWSKAIAIGPDQRLYVSLGSSCNVCVEKDARRATIMQFDTDGRNGRIYATGIRNSEGLDWAPWDNSFYATDNGRDMLGDNFPPCELNHIVEGGFYGWPFFNGDNIADPDLGDKAPKASQPIKPAFGFRAHNAPLGMTFIDGKNLPADFGHAALVALHGSWNRSSPDGYKVVSLHWAQDGTITARDFMTGFEHDGDIIGRPVDVRQASDGCIYISDDFAGSVYRVCYHN